MRTRSSDMSLTRRRVSVALSTHNCEQVIDVQGSSVLAQARMPVEIGRSPAGAVRDLIEPLRPLG